MISPSTLEAPRPSRAGRSRTNRWSCWTGAFSLSGPRVEGPVPGPRSSELLARQRRWESNARTYRRLPIAIAEASGSFIRDVDGNVFIDFLTGAGVLSLGHGHPDLVRVAGEQLARHAHGLDFPTPVKDAFVEPSSTAHGGHARPDEAALLRAHGRQRRGRRPQAVQDGHRPPRDRLLPGRLPRQQPRRDGAHRARGAEAAGPQGGARGPLLPVLYCSRCPRGTQARDVRH